MRNETTRSQRRRGGFTLMEMMVVIAILGLLATVVGPKVFNVLRRGNVTTAKIQIENLKTAVEQYRMNNNRLPDSLDTLTQADPKNFDDTYMDEIPDDPWSMPYEYKRISGSKFEIISYGADQTLGGDGEDKDISSLAKSDDS